jgi:hypothetical protein
MKPFLLFILQLLFVTVATSQSCLHNGITFSTQAAIDNFQTNYPGCTEIEGSVNICGTDISNLNGLSVLTSIGGNLVIGSLNNSNQNPNLTNLTGINNLVSVGVNLYINNNVALGDLTGLEGLTSVIKSLSIVQNSVLQELTGLNNLTTIGEKLTISNNGYLQDLGLFQLTTIGKDLLISYNGYLESLSGLENLDSIGGSLEISNNVALINIAGLSSLSTINGQLLVFSNPNLTSLEGLGNIAAGSISNMGITGNPLLTDCELQSICNYLSNPGGIVQIASNGPGCNSAIEVSVACGITSPCLPFGRYFCLSQADIDNFSLIYPGCTELEGTLYISGFDITNLEGISSVTSISGDLVVTDCESLADLTPLSNLVFVGGYIFIQYNYMLDNLIGLDGITTVPSGLNIYGNPYLTSLTGLENVTSIESLEILDNPMLGDLNGLNNLISVGEMFELFGNESLNDLTALSNLTSISGTILINENENLTSLAGLENIDASKIIELLLRYNPSLSDCSIKSICDYLINLNGNAVIEGNDHNCSSEEVVINFCNVGLAQAPVIENYKIYPNPATSYIIFRNDSPSTNNFYLTIYDINGRQLISQTVNKAVNLIDINSMQSGIYSVKIMGDQEVYVEKLVKK